MVALNKSYFHHEDHHFLHIQLNLIKMQNVSLLPVFFFFFFFFFLLLPVFKKPSFIST